MSTQVAFPRGSPFPPCILPAVPSPGRVRLTGVLPVWHWDRGVFIGWAGSLAGGMALAGQGAPQQQKGGGVKLGAQAAGLRHGEGVGNETSRGDSVGWEQRG